MLSMNSIVTPNKTRILNVIPIVKCLFKEIDTLEDGTLIGKQIRIFTMSFEYVQAFTPDR